MNMHDHQRIITQSFALLIALSGLAVAESGAELRKDFVNPPIQWASRPLWFWNGKLDADKTRSMVSACKEAGYYGMGILPTKNMGVEFMSAPFLDHYQAAVDQAATLGMKMCLYDEFWFPSGAAGGLLAKKHPEALSRRLDMMAMDVEGEKEVTVAVPQGTFMGAVAMNTATFERKNITAQVKDGKLQWQTPPGTWKVMLFTCVRDGDKGLVNFLDPEAVKRFIDLTYQAYYDKFPQHFGKTIDSAFYDEPGLYHVKGGRAWIDSFNERFQERFGFDPVVHYPALFFETIGPDTAAARNALFGMRAELYATGFPKTINDWCRKHGVELTGHVDQEELVNPVIGQSGDMIKAFKHQDMPGIDQVFAYGRASRAYKVVSSSAYNYGKSRVVTECYGGIDLPIPNLYKEAMDQFAKGINLMVPHAVWYNEKSIDYKPNLTPGDARYGPELKEYNRYIGRLHRLLHSGKQVADIGVLYPIATLQAGSWFGPGDPYQGCVTVPEADYMEVGETLSTKIRRDFNFVHPEVLDENCTLKGAEMHLQTASHEGRYQVFIIPGSRVIHWSSLKKIKAFYDHGGTVIATTQLPSFSAEFGKDKEVRETIEAIFGVSISEFEIRDDKGRNLASTKQSDSAAVRKNTKGGLAYFLPNPDAKSLKAALDESLATPDVAFEDDVTSVNGNLSYIHKIADERNVYFIGNSSDKPVETFVRLRGKLDLEWWDPHTGETTACEVEAVSAGNQPVTRVRLRLNPVRSVFLMQK